MFTKGELRQNLLGTLEIALFMRSGTARFARSINDMKKSFIIPALALPLTLIMVLAAHPAQGLSSGAMNILIAIYSLRLVLFLGLFLGLVYAVAKKMDKLENFYQFATANNWLMLPAVAVTLLPVLGLATGLYSWSEIQPLIIMATFYTFACTAFTITHVMRVPWELAGFAAITGLAIHQTSLGVLKWAAVNVVYLVS